MLPSSMQRWQLHPSGVNTFTTCGEKYRRRYLDRDRPRGRGESLIVGTALDVAVAADLLEKIRTGKLLDETDVLDIARDSVNGAFASDADFAPGQRLKAKHDIQERVRKMVEYSHRHLCNQIHPKSVQRPWSVRLDGLLRRRGVRGMKVDYVGTMDIEGYVYDFSSATEPAGTMIADIKSSGKSPPKDAASGMHWLQMASYALGKEVEDHVLPLYVQIDTIVSLKGGVTHRGSQAKKDNYDFAALFNRIERMVRALRAGIFLPASPAHWACSRNWCEYYESCPYVKNSRTIDLAVPSHKLYKIGAATNPEPGFKPPADIVQTVEREIIREDLPECQTLKKPSRTVSALPLKS